MEIDTRPIERSDLAPNVLQQGNLETASINLYRSSPFGSLTLEECEDLFRQRIEALTIIERLPDMSNAKLSDLSNQLREIRSHVYKANCILSRVNDLQQKKQDHFSHMLARMYCIINPELWDWFKSNEKKLLYYRLRDQASSLSAVQLEKILQSFNFDFQRVSGQELSELIRENLIGWRRDIERDSPDVFKVRFVDTLKFVAKRSVSLKAGYAFLTRHEIISVICDVFERHLQNEFNFARAHLSTELPQVRRLLESLRLVYLDHQVKVEDERKKAKRSEENETNQPFRIDIENLDEVVKKHYPPCMRYLHDSLMEDHHLKHNGRLHYGTFLRSGGVDMDSAIEFWRKEFTKKIPVDKFERDYKYNIRHLYGKEGHKKALSCFSCDRIIKDDPGPTDKHGCPFKHFDDKHLKAMLHKHEVKDVDIESIFKFRGDKDYRLACSHYFRSNRDNQEPSEIIRNPIHFYYESMRHSRRPLMLQDEMPPMDDEDKFDDD